MEYSTVDADELEPLCSPDNSNFQIVLISGRFYNYPKIAKNNTKDKNN